MLESSWICQFVKGSENCSNKYQSQERNSVKMMKNIINLTINLNLLLKTKVLNYQEYLSKFGFHRRIKSLNNDTNNFCQVNIRISHKV